MLAVQELSTAGTKVNKPVRKPEDPVHGVGATGGFWLLADLSPN